jgi:hypothetical protein
MRPLPCTGCEEMLPKLSMLTVQNTWVCCPECDTRALISPAGWRHTVVDWQEPGENELGPRPS